MGLAPRQSANPRACCIDGVDEEVHCAAAVTAMEESSTAPWDLQNERPWAAFGGGQAARKDRVRLRRSPNRWEL